MPTAYSCLIGRKAGKCSRLIAWNGASTFSGAIMLGVADVLAVAILPLVC